jgi:hypothetical protein
MQGIQGSGAKIWKDPVYFDNRQGAMSWQVPYIREDFGCPAR